MTEETLWDQVKDLEGPLGERLSGDPEVLHEVAESASLSGVCMPMARAQIKMILEGVPNIFSEDWKDSGKFSLLNEGQQSYGSKISGLVPECPVNGQTVQKIIELGVEYREQYSA